MDLLNRLSGRPFGLSPHALRTHGNLHPAFVHLSNFIERAPATMEARRAIVRQMQIANLYPKPKSLKRK